MEASATRTTLLIDRKRVKLVTGLQLSIPLPLVPRALGTRSLCPPSPPSPLFPQMRMPHSCVCVCIYVSIFVCIHSFTFPCKCVRTSRPSMPSPTLSPTDPVPRGLLTLCPWASSGPQGLYTAYMQPIYRLYTVYIQAIYTCARRVILKAYSCMHSSIYLLIIHVL